MGSGIRFTLEEVREITRWINHLANVDLRWVVEWGNLG